MFEDPSQLEQFKALQEQHAALEESISSPQASHASREYSQQVRRHKELGRILECWRGLVKTDSDIAGARELLADPSPEIRAMAQGDLDGLLDGRRRIEEELKLLLLPKDPNDEKNTVVEIRAGTGGEEAALFAGDLLRMYIRFSERRGWKSEFLSASPAGEPGAYKEVVFMVEGDRVYSVLKHESGVHRVQRVPATETQGRIHTSAVTVAVLPEAEEVEVEIRPDEIKVDVFRSSGPGGQSVNTTDSAVRVTHLPTGLVVTCQDEKSQLKNKLKALTVLRARLYDLKNSEQRRKISEERRGQVGTGDRSERIRTYNFPQGRVTDHRINLTLYKLASVLDGDLDELLAQLGSFFQARQLAAGGAGL
ncbi:MAG: peptide chain release factor 1 [Deltaproteobacteria bacterium]|jgi:peptide chain release factor 1|nr:peptide chain release factor 1 [Deltaproteobacteria bacterium]